MDNSVVCNAYLADTELRHAAEKLVYGLGIRADLKGGTCLVDAVVLYATKSCKSFCEIYAAVGAYRGKKPKSVLRDISYSLDQAFDVAARLSEMLGFDVPASDIHSSLVISYLGAALGNPRLLRTRHAKSIDIFPDLG